MPDLSHAWDANDDWSGVTNTTERRKRQYRLGQRAYRKRKHLARFASTSLVSTTKSNAAKSPTLEIVERTTVENELPTTRTPGQRRHAIPHIIPCGDVLGRQFALLVSDERAAEFAQRFFPEFRLQTENLSDLRTVVHLNVLNAIYQNGLSIGVTHYDMTHDDGISPFNKIGAKTTHIAAQTATPPATLLPTELQRNIVHHPWLDLIPFPGLRDCIIRESKEGNLNEDDLCDALYGPMYEGELTSFVVWGESWDCTTWELSVGFMKHWGWLLKGCPEVIHAANSWREKRGEPKINVNTGYIEEL